MRKLDKKNDLPPLYQAYLPGWDEHRSQKRMFLTNFSLPHEMLDFMVDPSEIQRWAAFEDGLKNMQQVLSEWGNSLAPPVDAVSEGFVSIGLWGDAAPYAHRDSIYLLTWQVLSGIISRHRRHWFACFPKRCGCCLNASTA